MSDTFGEELVMRGGATVVRLVGRMCAVMWGFTPNVIPVIIETMGPVRAVRWFVANFPRYLATLHVLGPVRTHLAALAISLSNGCVYCAYGRARALELLHLREHDRLFPLDARTVASWIGLSPREIGVRLRLVLEEAGLHAEVMWVERTLAIADGRTEPMDAAEARIAHLCRMVGTMNAIAIAAAPPLDHAHDAVNKDAALKERFARLQAAGV